MTMTLYKIFGICHAIRKFKSKQLPPDILMARVHTTFQWTHILRFIYTAVTVWRYSHISRYSHMVLPFVMLFLDSMENWWSYRLGGDACMLIMKSISPTFRDLFTHLSEYKCGYLQITFFGQYRWLYFLILHYHLTIKYVNSSWTELLMTDHQLAAKALNNSSVVKLPVVELRKQWFFLCLYTILLKFIWNGQAY